MQVRQYTPAHLHASRRPTTETKEADHDSSLRVGLGDASFGAPWTDNADWTAAWQRGSTRDRSGAAAGATGETLTGGVARTVRHRPSPLRAVGSMGLPSLLARAIRGTYYLSWVYWVYWVYYCILGPETSPSHPPCQPSTQLSPAKLKGKDRLIIPDDQVPGCRTSSRPWIVTTIILTPQPRRPWDLGFEKSSRSPVAMACSRGGPGLLVRRATPLTSWPKRLRDAKKH
ncbi:uncharacterized protein N7482_006220 [Penicillium canariense]|uniref:Uncharacterized protein n=1 Tax=Penicillium canariense TaxID=189055 RepID=A0A9W9LN10_9EURO|nr:uncharacterized protein N7482_006220 [Penicillium canariense]KAJ5167439.1 hypothetical protein N7482_006220 [Penicillium canariense]